MSVLIYGAPGCGKTTFAKTLREQSIPVVDSDDLYYALDRDAAKSIIFKGVKNSYGELLHASVYSFIRGFLRGPVNGVVLTNRREKNIVQRLGRRFDIGFSMSPELMIKRLRERKPGHGHSDETVAAWAKESLEFAPSVCDRFIVLEENDYISDFSQDVRELLFGDN